MNGLFITIEGPDSTGKTNILNGLFPLLKRVAKIEIIQTREPGGIPIAREIRAIILDPKNDRMDERTGALLYAAARKQHLVKKVLPAPARGKIVLCDKFVDNSLAYQGADRHISVTEITRLSEFATEGATPDFAPYLDVNSDTGLRGVKKNRQNQVDCLDLGGLEFHQRVRHAYLKLAEENPERIHKIDARKDFKEILQTSYHTIIEQYSQFFEN